MVATFISFGRISIHAPLAGCDDLGPVLAQNKQVFQSTHPLRGATLPEVNHKDQNTIFQSTHPLRGATRRGAGKGNGRKISIHAPLAGCDALANVHAHAITFQSTHPLRGATIKRPNSEK